MESMMAFGGEKLLNFILRKIYTTPNNGFEGEGASNGLNYTFKVINAPTGRLIPDTLTHNLEIDLEVKISVNGNGVNFARNVPMKAKAKIGISNGMVSISQLTLTNISPNPIDAIVVSIINSQIIPPIRTELRNIPLPRLNDLFGSGLSANIVSGSVISAGPSFQAGLRITGASGIANASQPTLANLQSLNTANSNRIIAVVSDEAVESLLGSTMTAHSHVFNKSATGLGFGAKIKGTIRATRPMFDIVDGVGRVTTTISINNLQGGIKAPFGGWKFINIPFPNARVTITNSISVSGNRAIITLTGVNNINIDLNFPNILSPVESLLEGLFNTILRGFHRTISDAVEGKRFEIFRLSGNLFSNLNVNLGFEEDGLSYFGNSVQAILRIN